MRKGISLGGLAVLAGALASAGAAPEWDAGPVLRRVKEVKESDRREWTKIPWAGSLVEARRLSRTEGRPVFLFSHEGNIDTGRC
jgi:hypothetical protein